MKMLLALLAFSFSAAASASVCYQIYSSANVLVWQGDRSPIELDHPTIEDEVKKMVPDGHLIIVDSSAAPCQPIDTRPESATPRIGGRYDK
jgi:hypothetical protein